MKHDEGPPVVGLAAFGGAIGGAVAGGLMLIAAESDVMSQPAVNVLRGSSIIVVYAGLGAGIAALWSLVVCRLTSSDGAERARAVVRWSIIAATACLIASAMTGGAAASLWLHLAIVFGAIALIETAWRFGREPRSGSTMALGWAILAGSLALMVELRLVRSARIPGGIVGWLPGFAIALAAGYAVWWLFVAIATRLENRMPGRKTALVLSGVIAALVLVIGAGGLVSEIQGLRTWQHKLPTVVAAGEGSGKQMPNVILISVDTLRADHVGYAGGDVRTPALDELADTSYVFENAFSVAPWTRPSFAAFFGGRYPSEMGVGRIRGLIPDAGGSGAMPYRWDSEHRRPVEAFRDAGYFTAAVVVNPHLSPEANADRGFDFYYHTDVHYVQPSRAVSVVRKLDASLVPFAELTPHPFELERAPTMTHYTLGLLDHLKARPTLFWVHYVDPHYPYDPPTIEPEQRVTGEPFQILAGLEGRTVTRRQLFRDSYAREIDYWDTFFAQTVNKLKSVGLWENSVVVFWSDHGEEFWEHGAWGHGHSLNNEQLHVPLLIHLPGQTESVRVRRNVTLLDVMPTLLETCGVDPVEGLHGRSLAPVFEGRDDALRPLHSFLEGCDFGGIRKALLNDRYKLIYDLDLDRFSLYDLQEDPQELHDIFGTAAAPDTSGMEADLRGWTEMSLEMMAETAGRGAAEDISPEIRQRLRDMGYIQ